LSTQQGIAFSSC